MSRDCHDPDYREWPHNHVRRQPLFKVNAPPVPRTRAVPDRQLSICANCERISVNNSGKLWSCFLVTTYIKSWDRLSCSGQMQKGEYHIMVDLRSSCNANVFIHREDSADFLQEHSGPYGYAYTALRPVAEVGSPRGNGPVAQSIINQKTLRL